MVSKMKETDWDKIFREKLKSIWIELNELMDSDLDKDLIQKHLKSIANNFIDVFSKESCPIPVIKNDYFYNNLNSASISLGSFSFLIPHTFFNIAKSNPKLNLDSLFLMPVSWYNFLSYFYETIMNIRKPLKESDVKIMSVITRYRPQATDRSIPYTNLEIAKLAGTLGKRKKALSENTVNKRIAHLYLQDILSDRFLINPWSIGYILCGLVYNKKNDPEMKIWDKWTNYKQIFMSNKILRVVRVPQHAEGEFIIPENVKQFEITENWYSNNISQLYPKDSDSFLNLPNFEVLKTSDYIYTKFNKDNDLKWIDKLLSMTYSTKKRKEEDFASLNKIAKKKRLEKAFKFLTFISKEQRIRLPITNTAKRSGLDEIHFLDFIRFFVDEKVINFVTHTTFIGCHYRFGVMIRSLKKPIKEYPLLRLFLQNLLELPLVIVFTGKYVIFSYIRIPLKWVGAFTTYLNILMTNNDLQIEFGTHMALQSYVHWNTPFSQDITLTSYGVLYNPQFELNNAKVK